ncbi:MAG: hypothetical protein Q9167_002543, partial [Letrouitia subvulpina]
APGNSPIGSGAPVPPPYGVPSGTAPVPVPSGTAPPTGSGAVTGPTPTGSPITGFTGAASTFSGSFIAAGLAALAAVFLA